MTREQAGTLVDKLQYVYAKSLPGPTIDEYLDALQPYEYKRADKGIDNLIKRERYFPAIATLCEYIEAAVVIPDGYRPWSQTEEADYAFFQQDKLVALDDANYLRYLFDEEYKAQLERQWRREWRKSMAIA